MSYSVAQPLSGKMELHLKKTWPLFLLVVVANMALMWLYNELVLTRDMYHTLLSRQMESTRIDEYFDFIRKVSIWGYVASPILLLINFTFVALLIQMPLVLVFIDIPFKRLFRLVTWASLLMVASAAIRFFWLATLDGTEITNDALNMTPFSINHLLDASEYPQLVFSSMGKFSIFEFGWCYVLYRGLASTGKIKRDYAALLILAIWTLLLLFQFGIAAYFQGTDA